MRSVVEGLYELAATLCSRSQSAKDIVHRRMTILESLQDQDTLARQRPLLPGRGLLRALRHRRRQMCLPRTCLLLRTLMLAPNAQAAAGAVGAVDAAGAAAARLRRS